MSSELVFLEYGWHTELLDALALAPRRSSKILYFHGVTPRDFVPEELKAGVDKSYSELVKANAADVVLHATDYSKRLIAGAGVTRPQFVRLPLPLDLPAVKRAAQSGTTVRFLNVSRMAPSKGHVDIVEALSRLSEKGFEDWSLRFVFNAKTAMRAYLDDVTALIARRGLAGKVELTGTVSNRAKLARLYAQADATLIASMHETYCFPLLESLACGTPVIAYASGAIPEVAAGRANIVPQGDINALAAAIERVAAARPSFVADEVTPRSRRSFLASGKARGLAQSREEFEGALLRLVERLRTKHDFVTRAKRVLRRILRRLGGA